jgi:DNA polymerase III alpha subunit
LVQYGYAKKEKTLKETYENIIDVYKIERENQEMWKLVWENKIISLFQMEQVKHKKF